MPDDLAPWRTVLFRVGLVASLLFLLIIILWIDRAGLKDYADGHMTILDVVYFTMVTITTVGYGDIVPVTPRARVIDAFIITPVRIFIWLLFIGTAYQLAIKQFAEGYRMAKLKASLDQHVVVCGVGHTGLATIKELLAKGTDPEQILAIDTRDDCIRAAVGLGVGAIRGDATHEATLKDTALDKANAVVISAGRDDTNTLILLTVRYLSPRVRILLSAKDQENVKLFRQGGANTIISPATVGGSMLAAAVTSSNLAHYLEDMLTAGGRVDIIEELVRLEDVGKTAKDFLPDVVLRVYRQGSILSLQDLQNKEHLQEGDRLLLLRPVPKNV